MGDFNIYFCDVEKRCFSTSLKKLNIQTYYSFEYRKIIPYNQVTANKSNIGDAFFGPGFVVIVCYENISLIEMTRHNWGVYIIALLDYLNLNTETKIKIHANNNNTIIRYNTLYAIYTTLFPILKRLNTIYPTIELI